MRLAISGLVLRPGEERGRLPPLAAERLGLEAGDIRSWKILRRSLDARGRREPRFVHTLGIEVDEAAPVPTLPGVSEWTEVDTRVPRLTCIPPARPIVVGSGPAGLFAALRLCAWGLRPIVLERGKPVEERARDVARYWRSGELDPESNVQFGEGGAGTYSDGKLTYRGKDARKRWVFEQLVDAGAGENVLFEARPHLGTDRLRRILKRLRETLTEQGAEVRFRTRVERLRLEGRRVLGVEHGSGELRGSPVFLAPGHSARDLFRNLAAQGVTLEAKGFAAGVRVELTQRVLDSCQYGAWAGASGLPPSEFTVKARSDSARDVYSFCMCPGGVVIPAGTEADGIVVNGMSGSGRRGPRANAALVVGVEPSDVGGEALGGLEWQRSLEAMVYAHVGPRRVPAQRVADFQAGQASASLPRSSCPWPLASLRLDQCLPDFAASALGNVLPALIRQLPPLADGLLLGVETRTSSPVRIARGEDLVSVSVPDLYPIGEGSGYAGGIVSAAVDGVRAADAWAARLSASGLSGEGVDTQEPGRRVRG